MLAILTFNKPCICFRIRLISKNEQHTICGCKKANKHMIRNPNPCSFLAFLVLKGFFLLVAEPLSKCSNRTFWSLCILSGILIYPSGQKEISFPFYTHFAWPCASWPVKSQQHSDSVWNRPLTPGLSWASNEQGDENVGHTTMVIPMDSLRLL